MIYSQTAVKSQESIRSISILGSTGSIGVNTVDLVKRTPDLFDVRALSANNNVSLLAEQAKDLEAEIAVVADENYYEDLKKAHTETVVPVTREDFERTKKFKSVESYRRHRAAQLSAPPSLQQSRAL